MVKLTFNLIFFLELFTEVIDNIYLNYANVLILGDFNVDTTKLKGFLKNYEIYSLINVPTCFKSTLGTCVDLILTNSKFLTAVL